MKRSEVTPDVLRRAAELGLNGSSAKEIQSLTGLNHSQVAWVGYTLEYYFVKGAEAVEPTGENIVALHDFWSVSIGGIMTMLGVAEDGLWKYSAAQVEKLYSEATKGITLKGQRVGKGGAFVQNDPTLYEGTLQARGTKLRKEEVRSPEARHLAAAIQKLSGVSTQELREMAKELGLSADTKVTPAKLKMEIAKAQVG